VYETIEQRSECKASRAQEVTSVPVSSRNVGSGRRWEAGDRRRKRGRPSRVWRSDLAMSGAMMAAGWTSARKSLLSLCFILRPPVSAADELRRRRCTARPQRPRKD
jgi:hypothetical protein